jgi:hypothetical protein
MSVRMTWKKNIPANFLQFGINKSSRQEIRADKFMRARIERARE